MPKASWIAEAGRFEGRGIPRRCRPSSRDSGRLSGRPGWSDVEIDVVVAGELDDAADDVGRPRRDERDLAGPVSGLLDRRGRRRRKLVLRPERRLRRSSRRRALTRNTPEIECDLATVSKKVWKRSGLVDEERPGPLDLDLERRGVAFERTDPFVDDRPAAIGGRGLDDRFACGSRTSCRAPRSRVTLATTATRIAGVAATMLNRATIRMCRRAAARPRRRASTSPPISQPMTRMRSATSTPLTMRTVKTTVWVGAIGVRPIRTKNVPPLTARRARRPRSRPRGPVARTRMCDG